MTIYLVRHAHAVDQAPDHSRPLSERGHEQVRVLGRFLRASEGFAPEEIWHSSLLRAKETAELLTRHAKLEGRQREVAGLRPEDNPAGIARELAGITRSVAVVGHEPHLSTLATLLVTGSAEPVVFVMKKCSALALERAGGQWLVRWHVHAGLIA